MFMYRFSHVTGRIDHVRYQWATDDEFPSDCELLWIRWSQRLEATSSLELIARRNCDQASFNLENLFRNNASKWLMNPSLSKQKTYITIWTFTAKAKAENKTTSTHLVSVYKTTNTHSSSLSHGSNTSTAPTSLTNSWSILTHPSLPFSFFARGYLLGWSTSSL